MLRDFYLAFAPISFTMLGLWMIVVQTRHAEWRRHPESRRRAYAVSLQFALPGLMGLLSLVDSSSSVMWRVSFAVVATGGVIVLGVLGVHARTRGGRALYGTAIGLYLVIIFVALVPSSAHSIGAGVTGLRVEAVLLSAQLFMGVNVAWLLMFDEVPVDLEADRS
jgi:hypothetical protein